MLNKSVLIADGIISLDLKLHLKKLNIFCEIVFTVEDLIEKTNLLKPDLIITDFNLNGREQVKEALKNISKTYNIPIIIISTYPGLEAETFSQTISSCSVMIEPFDIYVLLSLIQKYILLDPTEHQ